MNYKTTCASLALSLGLGVAANAAIIVPVTAVSSGTSTQNGDAGTSLTNLINGSGITGTIQDDATAGGATHDGTLSNTWVSTANGADFFDTPPGTVQIDFDLGGAYDLTTLYTWGYGPFGSYGNSASSVDVSYSTDGVNFSGTETIALTLPTSGTISADVDSLSALAGTTHVRLQFTDNGFGSATGGDRVGLSEVRFGGVAAVPEPSSTALLGLGGLALILRRRK